MKVLLNPECKSEVHTNVQLCQENEEEKWQSKEIPKDCTLDRPYTGMETEKLKPTNAQLWSYE